MLSTVLSKIGLPVLIKFVMGALDGIENPVAKTASSALRQVESALKEGLISPDQIAEANRHAEAMAKISMQEYETSLSEINQSIRAEIMSQDLYIRRMRPTFGYIMAFTWALQMLAVSFIVVFDTAKVAPVLEGISSLSTIWAVGLSVLGVYVYKRSEDKKLLK